MRSDRAPSSGRARLALVAAVVLALAAAVVVVAVALDDGAGHRTGADVEAEQRGRLLEATPISSGLPAWVEGWRIRYSTTDGRGRPAEASGVVLSARAAPEGPRPVLSVAHGTSGIQQPCAPSLQTDQFPVQPAGPVLPLLAKGWVAVQSDYLGLGIEGPAGVHPYLDGPSEAHAVLDATLAARGLDELDLATDTVVYGASQGGHAALFAGSLAPEYAPRLDLLGVAAAAPATDISFLVRNRTEDVSSLVVSSLVAASWARVHPDADVREHISSWEAAERIAGHCTDSAPAVAAQLIDAAPLFEASALEGRLGEVFAKNTPTGSIEAPVLVGQGLADPVVPARMQTAWVQERCADGQHLDYRTYPTLTHDTIVAPGSPFTAALVTWVEQRRAGAEPSPTC